MFLGCWLAFDVRSVAGLFVYSVERTFSLVRIEERAQACEGICHHHRRFAFHVGGVDIFSSFTEMSQQPNKSPEPTAVGAFRSAVAVHAASRRWLSFFR